METENKKPNDIPAFPCDFSHEGYSMQNGMTLRDYFANSAMQAFVNVYYTDAKIIPETIAEKAYKVADEMLKKREL